MRATGLAAGALLALAALAVQVPPASACHNPSDSLICDFVCMLCDGCKMALATDGCIGIDLSAITPYVTLADL